MSSFWLGAIAALSVVGKIKLIKWFWNKTFNQDYNAITLQTACAIIYLWEQQRGYALLDNQKFPEDLHKIMITTSTCPHRHIKAVLKWTKKNRSDAIRFVRDFNKDPELV